MRVGIYLRKSRAEDGVQDLAKHKKHLINICDRKGWSYELYEEIESSQALDRPELQRLREDIGLGKIDAVMVHAVDRLSRKQRHFLEIIEDYFLAQGVSKLYVQDTEQDLKDSTTITMLQIQATLSQAEYSFIVKRLNEGRKASLKQGIITGKVIYGYQRNKDTKLIEPHPIESVVVRKICDMLLEGEPYKAICDTLNSLGYRTRKDNLWDIYNIKAIAHSPAIRGHVVQKWKDEEIIVKDVHPAIITEAEYAKIKEITDNRATHYKGLSKAPTHWLQGLLKCKHCGKVMSIAGSKPSRKKLPDGTVERSGDYVYYIRACRPQIKGAERCFNKGCQAEMVEESIKDLINQYRSHVKKIITGLLETDADEIVKDKKDTVAELKRAINKLENKEEGLLDLLLDKTISKDTYNTRINNIKEEKADLIARLKQAEDAVSSVDLEQEIKYQTNIKDTLEQWDFISDEKKRQTLQRVFKSIEYSRPDKIVTPLLDVEMYEDIM